MWQVFLCIFFFCSVAVEGAFTTQQNRLVPQNHHLLIKTYEEQGNVFDNLNRSNRKFHYLSSSSSSSGTLNSPLFSAKQKSLQCCDRRSTATNPLTSAKYNRKFIVPWIILLNSIIGISKAIAATSISDISTEKVQEIAFKKHILSMITSLTDKFKTISLQVIEKTKSSRLPNLFKSVVERRTPTDIIVAEPQFPIAENHSLQKSIILLMMSLLNKLQHTLLSVQHLDRKIIKRSIIYLVFIFISLGSIKDVVQTRNRQKLDATSEWGRYADYPSARGRALFALMGRLTFLMIITRIVNSLPGGEYSILKVNIKNEAGEEAISVENNVINGSSTNNNMSDDDSWATKKAKQLQKNSGDNLAEGLLRLGPLYIKIGQIISCREKLLPDEWKKSLERLQDRVPAKSGRDALELAYQAYDGDAEKFHSLFSEFEDIPLAAASLGQVHRAKLKSNNTTVAIKLQRARLREIYDKDLALMNKMAKIVDTFAGKLGQVGGVKQSWEDIFKDAETILYREIDYRSEAKNAIRFASDFGIGKDGNAIVCTAQSLDGKVLPSAASWMRTPYVYEDVSTEKILVMEYVPSIKISEDKQLSAAGVSKDEKQYLAECLARAYLRQFCVNKFFSTDPHPGNLGVEILDERKDGTKMTRLVFYDFGQACALQKDQSGGILDVIEGIVDTNVDNCVNAFIRMGVLVDGADLDKVKSKVRSNFETGLIKVKKKRKQKTASNSPTLDTEYTETEKIDANVTVTSNTTSTNSEDIDDAEIMSFFTLPAEYAFVARAISQMDGVGKGLDDDFDFISASAPYIFEIKGGEKYLADEAFKRINSILEWQKKWLKQSGFDPSMYTKERKK